MYWAAQTESEWDKKEIGENWKYRRSYVWKKSVGVAKYIEKSYEF